MDGLKIPFIFIRNENLSPIDYLILSFIYNNINEDFQFYLSDDEIAKYLRINSISIPTIISKLFKLGYIDRSFEDKKRIITYTYDAPHKSAKSGYVYIMKDSTHNFLKIGFSNNPVYRESTLQGERPTITLVGKWKGTMNDEQTCHRILAKYRKRGEWFDISEQQAVSTIKNVLGIK